MKINIHIQCIDNVLIKYLSLKFGKILSIFLVLSWKKKFFKEYLKIASWKGRTRRYNRESGQSHNSFLLVSSFALYFTTTTTSSSPHFLRAPLTPPFGLRQEL